jgi:NAD(P)-dependent dehydrogenase (short-subunit alcohol dehydrogenase family)
MSQLFQTPFSRTSTASEVIDGADLSGRRAIVTGAGSGIGAETARAGLGRSRGHPGGTAAAGSRADRRRHHRRHR